MALAANDEYLKAVIQGLKKNQASTTLTPKEQELIEMGKKYNIGAYDCACQIVANRSDAENATDKEDASAEDDQVVARFSRAIGRYMFAPSRRNVVDTAPKKIEAAIDDYFNPKKIGMKLCGKKALTRCMNYAFAPNGKKVDAYAARQHLQTRGYIKVSSKKIRGEKGTTLTVHLYSHPNKKSAIKVMTNADHVTKMHLLRYDQNLKVREAKLAEKQKRAKLKLQKQRKMKVHAFINKSTNVAPGSEEKPGYYILDALGGVENLAVQTGADNFIFTKYGVTFDFPKVMRNGCNRIRIIAVTTSTFRIEYIKQSKKGKLDSWDLIKKSRDLDRRGLTANFVHETGMRLD